MLGPGERDVQETSILGRVLHPVRVVHDLERVAGRSDQLRGVDVPGRDSVLGGEFRVTHAAAGRSLLPEQRTQDDGELQPLRLVHREHLDGVIVAVDAAGQEFRRYRFVLFRLATSEGLEHLEKGRRRDSRAARLGLEQLDDVIEISEIAFAATTRQDAFGQTVLPNRREQ
jgi:hypothetical protein